ncbi:MEKHLA domain-containing protein [Pseudomonas akapageensis]|uniref:MEKHLA domain-containing protein n=1 Tax=Pseudomonas akapageensis TaxID=2609961 RepID=UPI00140B1FCA|nr:MEKHLA domain-containing protein [Pseudomonas akapageensis]
MTDSDNKQQLLQYIDDAFYRYHGYRLAHDLFSGDEAERLKWIDEHAPFALLAHDTQADPRFTYVNAAARRAFGYSEEEFIGLHSRLSANVDAWAERAAVLAAVAQKGYASGYTGVRVRKDGSFFRIERGELWCVNDAEGKSIGQAALVWAVGL